MPLCHGFTNRQPGFCKDNYSASEGKYKRLFKETEKSWSDDALEFLAKVMTDNSSEVDSDIPSGYVYLGQFIDHDITFDTTSLSEANADIDSIQNFRTPTLDLDCLYGAGPKQQPYLYKRGRNNAISSEFLLGKTPETRERVEIQSDLPRSSEGFALIADPRNDENLIVAQLHVAFMKFHNKILKKVKSFDAARAILIRSYQEIIKQDFLPRIIFHDYKNEFSRPQLYLDKCDKSKSGVEQPFIPIEFSVAAYRFGHSMIRERYRINDVLKSRSTLAQLFKFSGNGTRQRNFRLPSSWLINWNLFFDIDSNNKELDEFNFAKAIDTSLSPGLVNLILPDEPKSLALRNLQRGKALKIPSGQEVAKELGVSRIATDKLIENLNPEQQEEFKNHNLHIDTPLWYYILREAELCSSMITGARKSPITSSNKIGEVGGTIISQVFFGLLHLDKSISQKDTIDSIKIEPYANSMKDMFSFLQQSKEPNEIDPINPLKL